MKCQGSSSIAPGLPLIQREAAAPSQPCNPPLPPSWKTNPAGAALFGNLIPNDSYPTGWACWEGRKALSGARIGIVKKIYEEGISLLHHLFS